MIGSILTYTGEAPEALGAPDLGKVLELFKQQNEILKAAMTTCVIVPAGTKMESIHNQGSDSEDRT